MKHNPTLSAVLVSAGLAGAVLLMVRAGEANRHTNQGDTE